MTRRSFLGGLGSAAWAAKGDDLNLFITRMEPGAARGMTVGLKDLYDTAGVKTTAASAHFAERVPLRDAAIVGKLRAWGAAFVGKLNMDEFAFNFTSETSHFGPVQNPWKRGYTPGGSSGASAAAVAAGVCEGALGSDTGGSIRLPAALCGVVGFKPTHGRLPLDGVLPLAWSLDHAGPLARTVADARRLLAGMGLELPKAKRSWKTVRLGIPRAVYWEKLDSETERLVSSAVELLARSVGGYVQVKLPALRMDEGLGVLPATYGTIIMAEAFAYHEERLRRVPEKFHELTRANLEIGAKVPVGEYARARVEMEALRAGSGALFEGVDVLVMPTAPGQAFPLGSKADLIYLRNCAPWNLYGLPAVSVPCGFTSAGLPVGLQIVGRAGADELVLALAELYEKQTEWTRRRPAAI